MKIKIFMFLLSILFLAACGQQSVEMNNQKKEGVLENTQPELLVDNKLDCIIKTPKIVNGRSMEPILKDKTKVTLLENYYKCGHSVQKGDWIAYDYAGNKNMLIKIIKATDQDEIEILGGNMKINGEFLVNSAGKRYIFTKQEVKLLSLYIKDQHIPQKSFFAFGDNVTASKDSRKFGAVSAQDFLGKFEVLD